MIKKIQSGFEIYHDGILFIKHTEALPSVFFGNKDLNISMKNGEFEIINNTTFTPAKLLEVKQDELIFEEGVISVTNEDDRLILNFESIQVPFKLNLQAKQNEKIYGMGEHFTRFNLRKTIVKNWVEEHITRKQIYNKILRRFVGLKPKKWRFEEYKTYFIDPTFLSSANYFVSVDTNGFAEFDFKHETYHSINAYAKTKTITMVHKESLLEANIALCKFKGKMPRLPEWVYDGMIVAIQGGSEIVDQKINSFIEKGGKISGVWSQDFCGELFTFFGKQVFWNWEVDHTLYPKLKEHIKKWNQLGVRFLTYINPYLNANGTMFEYAKDHDYLVKKQDGSVFLTKATSFDFGIVDLTYQKAYDWFKGIIKTNYLDLGISGWMADFGEYLPTDCVLKNGNGEDLHNVWPDIWVKMNREVLEENNLMQKALFFNRAGYKDNVKYSTLIWNGDQHVDFTDDFGMGSVIRASLSLSMSGVGFSHSDIGGYTTVPAIKRSNELYRRWLEMNAFTPIMRSHEGNKPWVNVQFDSSEDVLNETIKFTNIHSLLKPYFQAVETEYQEQDIPMIRPLLYYFPIETDKAFLVGEDLYVVPILKKRAKRAKILIPSDGWTHILTGVNYSKGEHLIDCPLGTPTVFYRQNSKYIDVFKSILKYVNKKDVS